jgi:hypothetical protein
MRKLNAHRKANNSTFQKGVSVAVCGGISNEILELVLRDKVQYNRSCVLVVPGFDLIHMPARKGAG